MGRPARAPSLGVGDRQREQLGVGPRSSRGRLRARSPSSTCCRPARRWVMSRQPGAALAADGVRGRRPARRRSAGSGARRARRRREREPAEQRPGHRQPLALAADIPRRARRPGCRGRGAAGRPTRAAAQAWRLEGIVVGVALRQQQVLPHRRVEEVGILLDQPDHPADVAPPSGQLDPSQAERALVGHAKRTRTSARVVLPEPLAPTRARGGQGGGRGRRRRAPWPGP